MNSERKRMILVTGGAGFIGGCLAQHLANDPSNFVVTVDNFMTGHESKIPQSEHNNVRFIKADVNDYNDIAAIFFAHNFDYVFHYAALVGVKRTLANPIKVLQDVDGIKNVLNLCKNTGVKRVFYSSSSEVYGEPVEFPQNEHTTPLNSKLPYAIVKNIGESYMKSFKREYDLDFTIFRFFNTYGPQQTEDFVMKRFICQALRNEPITIYGDGSQTRTFCYIDDNIQATVATLYNNSHHNDILNIGNDLEYSILELAQIIIKTTGSKSEIIHLPALEEGDMTRRRPDNSKMREILNRDLLPLEAGIGRIVDSVIKSGEIHHPQAVTAL